VPDLYLGEAQVKKSIAKQQRQRRGSQILVRSLLLSGQSQVTLIVVCRTYSIRTVIGVLLHKLKAQRS